MLETHDYPVAVRWTGGTQGVASSSDGQPALTVAAPPEFGGPEEVWTPEHLFIASIASCFMTTYLAIARNSKLEVVALEVPAVGTLVRDENGRYKITHAVLSPEIAIADEGARERALRIADKAERACLITNSVKTEVTMEATIEVRQAAAQPV
jgi:peroxiredoxin-like protein